MLVWDFIFSGIYTTIQDMSDNGSSQSSFSKSKSTKKLERLEPATDKFESLEFFCLAMMMDMREDLLDNEESAVLGMLMSYKEPQ